MNRQNWQFILIFVTALHLASCQNQAVKDADLQTSAIIELSDEKNHTTPGEQETVPVGVEIHRKLRIGDEIGMHSRLDSSSSEEEVNGESIDNVSVTEATRSKATRTTIATPITTKKSEKNTAASAENTLIRDYRSTKTTILTSSHHDDIKYSLNDLTLTIAESMTHDRSKRQATADYVNIEEFYNEIDSAEYENNIYDYINLDAMSKRQITKSVAELPKLYYKVTNSYEQSDESSANMESQQNETLKMEAQKRDFKSQLNSLLFLFEPDSTTISLKNRLEKLESNQNQDNSEETADKSSSKNKSSLPESKEITEEIINPKYSDMVDVRKTADGMAYMLNFANNQGKRQERRWVTSFHKNRSITPVANSFNKNTDKNFLLAE